MKQELQRLDKCDRVEGSMFLSKLEFKQVYSLPIFYSSKRGVAWFLPKLRVKMAPVQSVEKFPQILVESELTGKKKRKKSKVGKVCPELKIKIRKIKG